MNETNRCERCERIDKRLAADEQDAAEKHGFSVASFTQAINYETKRAYKAERINNSISSYVSDLLNGYSPDIKTVATEIKGLLAAPTSTHRG